MSDIQRGERKRGTMPARADHVKEITKLLESQGYKYDRHDIFRDAISTMALSISNSVDLRHYDERERQYMDIVGRYDDKEVIRETFPKIMAHVVMAMEEEPGDVLGKVFGELELGNSARGQFFTPDEVSRLLAEMQVDDDLQEAISEKGYVTLHEPAVGAGSMVIAFAEAMKAKGLNYQQQLHVTAVDIDERAAQMAYVQFSLLHIPAAVYVGNTLSMEMRDVWHTPAHILDGWDYKLRRDQAVEQVGKLETAIEPPVLPTGRKTDIAVPIVGEQGSLFDAWEQAPSLDDGGIDR